MFRTCFAHFVEEIDHSRAKVDALHKWTLVKKMARCPWPQALYFCISWTLILRYGALAADKEHLLPSSNLFKVETRTKLNPATPQIGKTMSKTLIVYVFSDTDPEYLNNMNFYIQHGYQKNDPRAVHAFLVQEDANATAKVGLFVVILFLVFVIFTCISSFFLVFRIFSARTLLSF